MIFLTLLIATIAAGFAAFTWWNSLAILDHVENIRSRLPNRLNITFGADEPIQPNTKQNKP